MNDNREKGHTGPLDASIWIAWTKESTREAPELRVSCLEVTSYGGPSHGGEVPSSWGLGQLGQIMGRGNVDLGVAKHDTAMDGQPYPYWNSCKLGERWI